MNDDSANKSLCALGMSEIRFAELKNGDKGVALGEDDWFLQVNRENGLWKFRLLDLAANEALTAWISLKESEQLRFSTRAKPIRERLKQRWSNVSQIIEGILINLQENEGWDSVFNNEDEEGEENSGQSFADVPTEDVEAEVERILEAENQLEALRPHLNNVLPGEEQSKEACFTLCTGSKYPEVEMKQMILLKGTEGAGKTTLMREVTDPFKVKDVGRFSPHALDYSNLEGFEILRLKEIGVMDQETQGVSTIKFLSADDRGYTVEVTVRDRDTGELTTKQYRIPPITVISSTARVELDPQFQRRCWIFNVDESPEQTKRVLEWKAQREKQKAEVALGLRAYTDYDFSRAVLKEFVKRLEPCKIVIPFPMALTEVLRKEVLRVRGDYDRIIAFIKLYAFLNRKRLMRWREDVYIVTPKVFIEALKLIEKPLTSMMSSLEERTRSLLKVLKELGLTQAGVVIGKTQRDQIAVKLGRSEKTVKRYLDEWESAGYMSSDDARPKNYTLLFNLKDIEGKIAGLLDIDEMSKDLAIKMEKEAQNWLHLVLDKKVPEDTCVPSNVFWSQNQNETRRTLCSSEKFLSDVEKTDLKPSFNEKPSEHWTNTECPKIHGDPQSLPVKLERLTTNIIDKCMNPKCVFTGRMEWQATYTDGSWALLCYDCGLQLFRKIQETQNG
jgi:hypothetical protein